MKKIIIILLYTLLLTGCTNNNSQALVSDQDIKPNIMTLDDNSYRYYYTVDRNTHVVYLTCYAGNQAGITVYVNADGTPVLAEDLGIKVD